MARGWLRGHICRPLSTSWTLSHIEDMMTTGDLSYDSCRRHDGFLHSKKIIFLLLLLCLLLLLLFRLLLRSRTMQLRTSG